MNRPRYPAPLDGRRAALIALLGTLLPCGPRADLYDDYINSVSKNPFVAFLARKSPGSGGFPGHAYTGIGVILDNGLRVYERLLGYYPASDATMNEVKAALSQVSGKIDASTEDAGWDVEYRVMIDSAKRNRAIGVADRWMGAYPKYNLLSFGGKKCNNFMAEVAAAIGLKVPEGPGTTFPLNYVTALKKLHQQ